MKLLSLTFLCCLVVTINAQQIDSLKTRERKNNISINVGGESAGITINYQRYIINKKTIHFGVEMGAGYTLLAFGTLTTPTLLNVEIGKKHRACLEFAMSHVFNFSPYPKTKNERDAFIANPVLGYEDHYRDPYSYTLATNIGYKFIGKNGFNAKLLASVIYFKESPFLTPVFGVLPKLSVGYAF